MTHKRLLVAATTILLSAGTGFATSVVAQVAGEQPQQTPGTPPPPVGVEAPAPPALPSNFRRDNTISVMQRPREGYEARGLRLGTLLVYPQVTLAAEHDDNIFATSTGEVSDTILRVQPMVSVSSDWSRHALRGYAQASVNRYWDHPREDTSDFGLGLVGRVDVTRDTQITARADFSRGTEPRTSANSPTAATQPVRYDTWTAGVEGRHEFNRLLATGRLESLKFEYKSPPGAAGGSIDQTYRDRTVTTVGGRLDYAISPATAVFVSVTADDHEYRRQPPAVATRRDSSGTQVVVGVNFEITALMRGDLGVGYTRQTFDDPGSDDLEGFSANAQLEWFPTQLTTVTLSSSRTVEDSAVAAAPAYLSTNVRVKVDHELKRNIILSGQVGYGDDDYTGVDREDRRKSAGVGATYLINRALGVKVSYDYSEQKTRRGVGNNFKDNRVGATLTVQY